MVEAYLGINTPGLQSSSSSPKNSVPKIYCNGFPRPRSRQRRRSLISAVKDSRRCEETCSRSHRSSLRALGMSRQVRRRGRRWVSMRWALRKMDGGRRGICHGDRVVKRWWRVCCLVIRGRGCRRRHAGSVWMNLIQTLFCHPLSTSSCEHVYIAQCVQVENLPHENTRKTLELQDQSATPPWTTTSKEATRIECILNTRMPLPNMSMPGHASRPRYRPRQASRWHNAFVR